jgi:hypothetical protein
VNYCTSVVIPFYHIIHGVIAINNLVLLIWLVQLFIGKSTEWESEHFGAVWNRVLRGQVFSIRNGTGKFSHSVPQVRSGSGNLYFESHYQEREWILISPANDTGSGHTQSRDSVRSLELFIDTENGNLTEVVSGMGTGPAISYLQSR